MLKQTKKLIKNHGKKLISGNISDASLHELLISPAEKKSPFKKYPESDYVDPNKVNDKNFGVMDGMKDFVLHLAPQMPRTVLHEITARLIQLSPATIEINTFMRQAGIAKVFLAYELYLDPDAAEEHFSTIRMKNEFPGPNDIPNLQRVILEPIIVFFEEHLKVGRRNSLAGFTEPMPQAPTHERIPSEPAPVSPDLLIAGLAQMAAVEPTQENTEIKSDLILPSLSAATIASILSANPISPRKSAPFKRQTAVNSDSTATTESSSAIDNAVEVNDKTAAVPVDATNSNKDEQAAEQPSATVTTTATTSSVHSQHPIPQQSARIVMSAPQEQQAPLVARPETVQSTTAGVPNGTSKLTPPALPLAAQLTEPARRLDELNPTLSQLTELCQAYARHLEPHAIADNLASKKLSIVNDMLTCLENPRVPYATVRIHNMSLILTTENKELLKGQRSNVGVKFLETLLNIFTIGLYSKGTKNTFSFWKSHGEVLSDNVENLTKDNNSLPIK